MARWKCGCAKNIPAAGSWQPWDPWLPVSRVKDCWDLVLQVHTSLIHSLTAKSPMKRKYDFLSSSQGDQPRVEKKASRLDQRDKGAPFTRGKSTELSPSSPKLVSSPCTHRLYITATPTGHLPLPTRYSTPTHSLHTILLKGDVRFSNCHSKTEKKICLNEATWAV